MLFTRCSAVLVALVTTLVGSAMADDTCYLRRDDQIIVKHDWFACSGTSKTASGASLCCRDGDMCGPDMICRTPDVQEGNEWYVGGCTDKSYNDPVCSKDCSSYSQPWITYNARKNNYWACCGDYDCDDDKPSSRLFEAVSPTDWKEIPQSGSSDNGGLSQAATIGIGVGVGVVALAIIALAAWFFFRRKRGQATKPGFGRNARAAKYEVVRGPADVQMPFVYGENQPYERPTSPMPGQTSYRDQPTSGGATYQPPRD